MIPMLALAALSPAHAFCGVYLGSGGDALYNEASKIAIARQGQQTTLTMVNDYQGPATDFALLVPVPEVPEEGDIQVIDREVIDRVEAYSAPRMVSYTCDQLHGGGDTGWYDGGGRRGVGCFGCGDKYGYVDSGGWANDSGGLSPEDITTVTVEAEFVEGEYEIVVLSAEESGDLLTWLDLSGYAVPAEAEDMLGEYIDAGSYFFAARVQLEAEQSEVAFLSPLQVRYDAEVFSLPIRLGTVNSAGEQDLLIYALTDAGAGAVGISNYPEVAVEAECMVREEQQAELGQFYLDQVGEVLPGEDGAGWILEHSWAPSWCDPCTGDPLFDSDVAALGFGGGANDAWFTRLHLRYTPEAVTQDLALYEGHGVGNFQTRYIQHSEALEADFPVCREGWIEDGGTCFDDGQARRTARRRPKRAGLAGPAGILAFLFSLAALRRRR